ncbi:MAG: RNA polymerase sigma-70 factor (ECF subfamily) [Myxococcota bacterium]
MDVEALYRRYGDMVLSRCRTLLGNDADAAESCQEVFLKLHRYQDSFRGESKPSTYLYKIATTTCLNKLRSRKRRREDPVAEPIVVPYTDTMLSHVAVRDLAARVTDLADEGTKLCLIYHYVDGMTHAEVGTLLGITAGAVRKRIRVFRNSIRNNPPAWLVEANEQ